MRPLIICILALYVVNAAEEVKKRGLAGVSLGYKQFDLGGPIELSNGVKDYNLPLSLGSSYYLNNAGKGFGDTTQVDLTSSLQGYKYEAPQMQMGGEKTKSAATFQGQSFQGYKYEAPQIQWSGGDKKMNDAPLDLNKLQGQSETFEGKIDSSALDNFKLEVPTLKVSQGAGKLDASVLQNFKSTGWKVPAKSSGASTGIKSDSSALKGLKFNAKDLQNYKFGGGASSVGAWKFGSAATPSYSGQFDLSKYASGGHSFGGNVDYSYLGKSFGGGAKFAPATTHIDAKELQFGNPAQFDISGLKAPPMAQEHAVQSYQSAGVSSYKAPPMQSYQVPTAPTAPEQQSGGWNQYDASALGGKFDASSLGGKYDFSSASGGDYDATAAGGKFDASSFGGQFDVSSLGGKFDASSLGGKFDASSLGGKFDASSLGGKFDASSLGGKFDASSLGGKFDASSLGGKFDASSLGGKFDSSSFGGKFDTSSLGANYATAPTFDGKFDASQYSTGSGYQFDTTQSIPEAQYDTPSIQSAGGIKQISPPDLTQYGKPAAPVAEMQSYQPQQDKIPAPSQQISLGSGALGVAKLPNGKFALGSGSLGYAAPPPQAIKGIPLGTVPATPQPQAQAQFQPQLLQQSYSYDNAYLKGI